MLKIKKIKLDIVIEEQLNKIVFLANMNIKPQYFFSAINAAKNSEIGTRYACMNEPKRNVTE